MIDAGAAFVSFKGSNDLDQRRGAVRRYGTANEPHKLEFETFQGQATQRPNWGPPEIRVRRCDKGTPQEIFLK